MDEVFRLTANSPPMRESLFFISDKDSTPFNGDKGRAEVVTLARPADLATVSADGLKVIVEQNRKSLLKFFEEKGGEMPRLGFHGCGASNFDFIMDNKTSNQVRGSIDHIYCWTAATTPASASDLMASMGVQLHNASFFSIQKHNGPIVVLNISHLVSKPPVNDRELELRRMYNLPLVGGQIKEALAEEKIRLLDGWGNAHSARCQVQFNPTNFHSIVVGHIAPEVYIKYVKPIEKAESDPVRRALLYDLMAQDLIAEALRAVIQANPSQTSVPKRKEESRQEQEKTVDSTKEGKQDQAKLISKSSPPVTTGDAEMRIQTSPFESHQSKEGPTIVRPAEALAKEVIVEVKLPGGIVHRISRQDLDRHIDRLERETGLDEPAKFFRSEANRATGKEDKDRWNQLAEKYERMTLDEKMCCRSTIFDMMRQVSAPPEDGRGKAAAKRVEGRLIGCLGAAAIGLGTATIVNALLGASLKPTPRSGDVAKPRVTFLR